MTDKLNEAGIEKALAADIDGATMREVLEQYFRTYDYAEPEAAANVAICAAITAYLDATGGDANIEAAAIRIAAERALKLSRNGADDDGIALNSFRAIATPETVLRALLAPTPETREEAMDPLARERKVAIDILSNWAARYVHPRYQDDINCAIHHAANAIAAYAAAPKAPIAEGWLTAEDTLRYVLRYGGNCRDCELMDGEICSTSGLPCRGSRKAVKWVLDALNYGVSNGYLPAPPMKGE
ncbi:MAG: hypothetical protein P4L79_10010 [Legionella sp.]|uniref:hypothetical protein n=1 Tax=Legionella sp. TaxID=459 RepID=UPI0028419A5C|nr:hypothetical protein [Legionella sp.]